MSEKGVLSKSIASNISEAIINKLGGTGYAPTEWKENINLLGIASADIADALASITEDASSADKGLLSLPIASDVGAMLNKKYNTSRGFKPSEVSSAVSALTVLPEKTASSAPICTFNDGADDVPTKSLVVTIPPTISGVSEIAEKQARKNFLDTAIAETKSNNSVSITCDGNGKYTATGTATGGSANITFTLKTPCTIKSGMYLHLMNSANASTSISIQRQNNTSIFSPTLSPANRILDLSSYAGETIYTIRFYVVNGASFEMELTPMICVSGTETTYEPYTTPTTYTASLGQTINGGSADIVNGTGKKNIKVVTVDENSTLIMYSTGYIKQTSCDVVVVDNDIYPRTGTTNQPDGLVGNYLSFSNANIWNTDGYPDCFTINQNQIHMNFENSRIGVTDYTQETTASVIAKVKAYLQNHPFVCTVPVAETDFTFTGQEINTKLGYNAFWSEEGDTEVTYRADLDLEE